MKVRIRREEKRGIEDERRADTEGVNDTIDEKWIINLGIISGIKKEGAMDGMK